MCLMEIIFYCTFYFEAFIKLKFSFFWLGPYLGAFILFSIHFNDIKNASLGIVLKVRNMLITQNYAFF